MNYSAWNDHLGKLYVSIEWNNFSFYKVLLGQ